jgi:hypothetical protein
VNIPVTVQTGLGKHFVRRGWSLKSFKTSVGAARMARRIVATAANLGNATGQEFIVITAMGNMAS